MKHCWDAWQIGCDTVISSFVPLSPTNADVVVFIVHRAGGEPGIVLSSMIVCLILDLQIPSKPFCGDTHISPWQPSTHATEAADLGNDGVRGLETW